MATTAHDRYAGIFTRSSSAAAPSGGGTDNPMGNNLLVVSPGFETRSLLESLHAVPVVDIGSDKFLAAYCVNLERLSVQAHWTAGVVASSRIDAVAVNGSGGSGNGGFGPRTEAAIAGTDDAPSSLTGGVGGNYNEEEEFIVEAFLENIDKLEALVKTLLALELWREKILFCSGGKKNAAIDEEEEVEFEIEGGEREDGEYYNALNDVDGGEEEEDIVPPSTGDGFETKGLASRLAANGNALRTAFILHAETTIVSLLSLIFYKSIPAELSEDSSGDEMLLSLVDYCGRQLIFLGSPEQSNPSLSRQKHPLPASRLSAYLQTRSRVDEIRDSVHDSSYQTAVASVTLARYLCENAHRLGPSLLSRMLEMHDFPLLMVPLIEEPPWTRRRSIERRGMDGVVSAKMIWEKLDDHNEWKEVPPADLLRLTKLEGQPWLALFHLLTAKACRESYGLDEYRKSRIMRVRKYIHETLTDQLPVLGDVARYMDELSILGVPPVGQGSHRPSSGASSSGLLLTRVDLLRESIIAGGKKRISVRDDDDEYWERIARTQWEDIFSRVTDSNDGELRRIAAEVYGGAGMEDDIMANAAADDAYPAAGRNDLQMAEPLSTGEDWKVALSKPIELVFLTMKDAGDTPLASFELTPEQNGAATATTTDTPLGTFRRLKMSISQTGGNGDSIVPHASAVACIRFQKEPSSSCCANNEVKLCVDSLQLPTIEHGMMSENTHDEVGIVLPEIWPMKEWRQIGDLEGKGVVLQLGFKRLPRGTVPAGSTLLRGYTLSQAFVSQPCLAD